MTTIGTWNLENLFRPGAAGGTTTVEAYQAASDHAPVLARPAD